MLNPCSVKVDLSSFGFPLPLAAHFHFTLFTRSCYLHNFVEWREVVQATHTPAIHNLWGPATAEECNKRLSQVHLEPCFAHKRTHKQKTSAEYIGMSLREVSIVCTWTQLWTFISQDTHTVCGWLLIELALLRLLKMKSLQSQSKWPSLTESRQLENMHVCVVVC